MRAVSATVPAHQVLQGCGLAGERLAQRLAQGFAFQSFVRWR
jgi:hypothetical protein